MGQSAKLKAAKGGGNKAGNKAGGKSTGKDTGKDTGKGAFTVNVEVIAWVRTFLDGPASGTHEFQENASDGDTVRDVLKALSARYPKLDHALWDEHDREEIGTHIEIIVNDTIMGNDYTLETPVESGYQIILTGQYIGG